MRLRIVLFLMLTVLAHCVVGRDGSVMATARRNAAFGTGGYDKAKGDTQNRGKNKVDATIKFDDSKEAADERVKIAYEFLHFYNEYWAPTITNRKTGQKHKQTLSLFHLFMIDFLHLDLMGKVEFYSPLKNLLPDKDEFGNFPEYWFYWKTLEDLPDVQPGPEGDISKMFYEGARVWQGMVIRICGDGYTKCLLAPRLHLKSTICAQVETLWRIIRDPALRHAIRCMNQDRAKEFLAPIASAFTANEKFAALYGHLRAQKRDDPWNTERIQLAIPQEERRGVDPTVITAGLETDLTGSHPDCPLFDDIVGEKNSTTVTLVAKTRATVEAAQAQRETDSTMTYLGTPWDEDDASSLFVGRPGRNEWSGMRAEDTCFFQATLFDGDETVKQPPLANGLFLTPLGYGKPIWPEKFTRKVIATKRGSDDRFYCSQYFGQFAGTTNRLFKKAWIRNYSDAGPIAYEDNGRRDILTPEQLSRIRPEELARKLKLNITFGNDTASGKKDQAGKLDRTAGLVLGQTQDRMKNFVLDGYREKLPAEQIAIGIVDKAVKWNRIAMSYRGSFRASFEDHAYTNFLEPLLKYEQKKHGVDAIFPVEALSAQQEAKVARAKLLVTPHCEGMFFWPYPLDVDGKYMGFYVDPVALTPDQTRHGETQIEPYDFRELLEGEFVTFSPTATADDIIDAYAYAYAITYPTNWKEEKPVDAVNLPHGTYSRAKALEEAVSQDAGGYVPEEMERAY